MRTFENTLIGNDFVGRNSNRVLYAYSSPPCLCSVYVQVPFRFCYNDITASFDVRYCNIACIYLFCSEFLWSFLSFVFLSDL